MHLICLQTYQNKTLSGYLGSSKQPFQEFAADLFITARLPGTVGNIKLATASLASLHQWITTDNILEDCVFLQYAQVRNNRYKKAIWT